MGEFKNVLKLSWFFNRFLYRDPSEMSFKHEMSFKQGSFLCFFIFILQDLRLFIKYWSCSQNIINRNKLIYCKNQDESSLNITLIISRNTLNTNSFGHKLENRPFCIRKLMRNFIKSGELLKSKWPKQV